VLVLGNGGDSVEDVPPTPGQVDGLAALERDFGEDHGLPLGIPQLDFVEGDLGPPPAGRLRTKRSFGPFGYG
jgi:hypothetical protein